MYMQAPDSFLYPTTPSAVYYTQDTPHKTEYIVETPHPTMSIKTLISKEIVDAGYTIEDINISSFSDSGVDYKIYTIELKEEIEDYSLLLQTEKSIKQKLGLYDKKIILELV
ncbi:hypothetical protein [Sulfurimonas sp. NWX79]|uniref:hypothetical protein n=1 Tax=Campylobacterales TaxID=213849 RepID=UPI003204CED5|nr:hypothetical protein IAPFLPAM_00059 [Sulfurimonas phage SNW-1]